MPLEANDTKLRAAIPVRDYLDDPKIGLNLL